MQVTSSHQTKTAWSGRTGNECWLKNIAFKKNENMKKLFDASSDEGQPFDNIASFCKEIIN